MNHPFIMPARAIIRSVDTSSISRRGPHDSLKMLETVLVFSVALLIMASSIWGQKTCDKIADEQYSLCQCRMSDGSGTIDLSPYANAAGNPT